ncbi:MAG TPA: MBL fold metallo-hydrolase [Steroidobacteraceae bacterium]|nr:MBL fold metallo-hydrolase [Steroidobacteraceae bacterium]
MTRRSLLQASLGAAGATVSAGVLGSLLVPAAQARAITATILTTPLADDLFLVQGAGANVVVAKSGDGLLLVDGGLREVSETLIRHIAGRIGKQPVRQLVNTHWHWNHTGSNEMLAKSGASILAHENTKLWLATEIISPWEGRTYPSRPAGALPTQTFFYDADARPLSFAGQTLEYSLMPGAHTDGDLYVFFPRQNVLAGGGVISGGEYPLVDYVTGGWLGGMIGGLKAMLKKGDASTRFVPGNGPLRTRADVEAQIDVCFTALSKIGESYYKGQTWDELVASKPMRDFDARWGNPDTFLRLAYEGAWNHINEIRRVTR